MHVFLEVDRDFSVCVGGAGYAEERGAAAARTELLGHVSSECETCVAAEDVRFKLGYAVEGGGEEVEIHTEENVLHGVVGG